MQQTRRPEASHEARTSAQNTGFKWWFQIPLDVVYLAFCAPLILALAYILPPFQAPDEASHFYRAVQLSHGQAEPSLVYNSYRQGAGGYVDQSVHELVNHRCGTPNWRCALKQRPALSDLVASNTDSNDSGVQELTAFSNTVVYLPLAHAVPAIAIAAARWLGVSPLGWLYAGRLANGLLTIGITWCSLRLLRFQRAALLIFAVSTLPMVTSIGPALGADSSVICFSMLLLAICWRLLDGSADRSWFWPALIISVLYAAAAKLAYLPLAILPIGCALAARSPRQILTGTVVAAVISTVLLAAWSVIIHAYVFPISTHLEVDPSQQIQFVKAHPIGFVGILLKSMIVQSPDVGRTLIGSLLSSLDVSAPKALLLLAGLTLTIALLFSGFKTLAPSFRVFSLLIVVAAACATFAFLYLQNTVVGAPQVVGYQGRYLIPLIPFVALILPKLEISRILTDIRLRQIVGLGGVSATLYLALFLALRTW